MDDERVAEVDKPLAERKRVAEVDKPLAERKTLIELLREANWRGPLDDGVDWHAADYYRERDEERGWA